MAVKCVYNSGLSSMHRSHLFTRFRSVFFMYKILHQRRHFFVYLCLLPFGCFPLKAQSLRPFVKPGLKGMVPSKGISFEIGNSPEFRIVSSTADNRTLLGSSEVENYQRLKLKGRIPLWNAPGLKVVMGLKYEQDRLVLDESGSLQALHQKLDQTLRSSGTDLVVLKPFRGNDYLVFRGGLNMNGAYSHWHELDAAFLAYNFSMIWGRKVSDRTEWGLGLHAGNNLGRVNVFPIATFFHNFSPRWGIEATLPRRVLFRHNLSPNMLLATVAEVEGTRFYIPGSPASDDYVLQIADFKTGLSVQRKLFSLIWASAETGYRKSLNFDFLRPLPNQPTYARSWIPGGLYANFSIFLVPPLK